MMDHFIEKLEGLNLFLVEKDGDLILKGRKGELTKEEIASIMKDRSIVDFIKENKQELIRHLLKTSVKERAVYKLSPLQEGMLFHHLYDGDSNAYTEQFIVNFPVGLDTAVFKSSWNYVLQNHSILRSSFIYDQLSIPVQCVHTSIHLPVKELDFSVLSPSDQEKEIQDFLARDRKTRFDFGQPPLMRIALIKTGVKSYQMIWTYHHILLDGWSMPVIMEEFLHAYEVLSLGELPEKKEEDRYEDFIKYISSKNPYEEEAFWKQYLEGFETPGILPFAENVTERNKGGGPVKEISFSFDAEFTNRIRNYAQAQSVTVNTLIQGIWSLLLSKYTGNPDTVFGITVSGRPADLENAEKRVGLYINILPLRSSIKAEESIEKWLSAIQAGHASAREYQYTALNKIQSWNNISGDFFDSILVFENYPVGEVLNQKEWGLKTGEIQVKEQNNYLLTIVANLGKTLNMKLSYNSALLGDAAAEMIKAHFTIVFQELIEQNRKKISEISILTGEEKQVLLTDYNKQLHTNYPKDKTVVQLFEAQVAKTPDLVAVVSGDNNLTYRQLNELSNQLAHYLRSKGVREESLVALCLDRSCDMIVSIMAVLKAGGAYVPIDPEYPMERINYLLEDTAAPWIISSKLHRHLAGDHSGIIVPEEVANAISQQPVDNPITELKPDNLAYIIYTSGSTGLPKGVQIEHKNMVRLFLNDANLFDFNENDVWTLFHSYCFDFSVWEIFGALLFGGRLIVISSEMRKDPMAFGQLLVDAGVTVLNQTPGAFYQLQDTILQSRPDTALRYVIFGGEALNPSKLTHWKATYPDCRLINMYGITETTVHVTYKELLPADLNSGVSNIGKPIPTLSCYVLDSTHNLAVPGIAGELYVGGSGLARGYLNRPELTDGRFIRDHFSEDPKARLYKTGDLVRWLSNGDLEYLGRIDNQVKIHGYRIELGEIEAVLQQFEGVKQSAVLTYQDASGNNRLYACIVAEEGQFDKKAIHDFLKSRLPEYMVPALFIEMPALPLTPNGKIDKKALPAPDASSLLKQSYLAPRNETEEKLVQIWKDVLKIENIGIRDNFFEIGGHSLLAIRMVSAIRKAMQADVKIKEIFSHPTIEDLAQILEVARAGEALPPLIAEPRPSRIPLSYSQERLWFIDQLQGSTAYHLPTVIRLKNELDRNALETALSRLVHRHEILHTVIKSEEGSAYQQTIPAESWRMTYSEGAAFNEQTYLTDFIAREIERPFDLSKDYSLRAHLIRCHEKEHILVLVVHHIASDGWSESILVKDLAALYVAALENRNADLAPLPIQYADYAIWQRKHQNLESLSAKLSWWAKQLHGVEPIAMPTDYPRPLIQSTRGRSMGFLVDELMTARLKALSNEAGATLFMTLLTAFKVMLYRYSGQEDICVGTPIANRTMPETEALAGFFVNTLALRTDLGSNPDFLSLLEKVKGNMLAALAHQEVPFEQIVEKLEVKRSLSRSPIFQVMFTMQNMPETANLTLKGLELDTVPAEKQTAQFELTFSVIENQGVLQIGIEYCSDLFSEVTIARMSGHFNTLLESIAANPAQNIAQLPMLSPEETHQLLSDFNNTAVQYPHGKTLVDLFEAQAAKTPKNTALVFENESITYAALNQRANQLARYLKKLGVGPETLVSVCMDRSPEMIISLLGILKSGGAYVPVDPDYPAERIAYILEDSASKYVITKAATRELLSEQSGNRTLVLEEHLDKISTESTEAPESNILPENLAYVIYTSGSTGKPKGVMIEHQNVYCFLNWCQSEFSGDPFDVVYGVTSICFDLSVFEIFYTLTVGKKLRLLKNALDIKTSLPDDKRVLLNTVPSVVRNLLDDSVDLSAVSVLNMAGEPIPKSVTDRLDPEKMLIRNLYGPSEDTTYSTNYRLQKGQPVWIGRPIANTQIYILGKYLNLMPSGGIGEICIGGAGLSRGYLNQPGLSAEKFIQNPFEAHPSARLYKTGDLGRWTPQGDLDFLGRIDAQVKIRGFRIELGEIEAVLQQSSLVKACVVLVKEADTADKQLIAYVVPETTFDKEAIRQHLQAKLPDYMLPSLLIELTEMPLTPNGKIDKKALPDADSATLSERVYVAPRNQTEAQLALIWQELLPLKKVGIFDNFFESGGHSLLAMRVISLIRKQLNQEIQVSDVFHHPSIAQLAAHLETRPDGQALPPLKKAARTEKNPLSYSQERLWFVDQFEGSTRYHQPTLLRLTRKIDIQALEGAFRDLIERHEVLRTVIEAEEGQAFQKTMPAASWKMAISEGPEFSDPEYLKTYVRDEITHPFDLTRDYMLRARLVKCSEEEYLLILVVHHIASDGWSESILVRDLAAFYQARREGRRPNLEPLPIQYSDYAVWQRTNIAGAFLEQQLSWWQQYLADIEPLKFPTDLPRPATQSNRGASLSFEINQQLTEQLKSLSGKTGTSLFMTLLAAFKVLLYRYTGQEDLCIGTPSANRNYREVESLAGFFINTLVLRNNLGGNPDFLSLLEQVKKNTLLAFSHQEVPFEKIVDRVEKDRDLSRNPVFQVAFTLENTPEVPELELGKLSLSSESLGHITSNYDLTFSVKESKNGLWANVVYSVDLFTEDRIARMAAHFQKLLQSITADPEQAIADLSILSEAETEQLVFGFNETNFDYPADKTILDLFEAQAALAPNNIAVQFGQTTLTYKSLNERSNQLGAYIRETHAVRPGDLIGIKLDRSEWMILTILGILKSGGAYLPIDIKFPEDRIQFMLEDSQCKALIDDKVLADFVAQQSLYSHQNLSQEISPRSLAYVIYTSGSTGRSKGVQIEHGSLVNEICSLKEKFRITEQDRILQTANYVFDPSIEQIFLALLSGATLVLITRDTLVDGELMEKVLDEKQITYLHLTPSLLKNITPRSYHSLRQISAGGELCTLELARSWAPYLQFVNKYGPTEATITSTTFPFDLETDSDKATSLSIGRPLGNAQVYILDKQDKLTPIGVFGEICIGGAGLARGYLNRPELTREKFVEAPFLTGKRIYKTGDLGRWLADGKLEFLARKDDQVKIRGYRVELGEIESVLQRSPLIATCVVLAKETPAGDKRLVAYVVPRAPGTEGLDKEAVKRFLESQLPDYMIPAAILELAELPLTVNGKVDKKALPDPELHLLASGDQIAPRTETEEKLAAIWKGLLQVETLGVHDNFFEIGGHSLLAMRVISAIRKTFNQEVKVKDIFTHPTIAGLAANLNAVGGVVELPALKAGLRPEKIPLSYAQERLWFIDQFEGSVQYHQPTVLRLKNKLDKSALETAFAGLIERHESLRTVIRSEDGQAFQEVMPAAYWRMKFSDDPALTSPDRMHHFIAGEVNHPFNLSDDYLLRAHLVRHSEEEHVLILVLHHIAADGWSQSLLVRDLMELYSAAVENRLPGLAPLDLQYADYAVWQRKYMSGDYLEKQLSWWEKRLEGLTPLNLPLDYQRPATQSTRGASMGFRIDKNLTERLKEVSVQSGATLFMTLLSAYKVLLARYSGQDDICVGMPIANRNQKELEPMVGFFINTLVLRNDLSGNPAFSTLLNKVKEQTLAAFAHQEVPFEQIVERVESERNLSRSPVFQVVFNMQNTPEAPDLDLAGLSLEFEAPGHDLSRFDLTISVNETRDGLQIALSWCSDLFSRDTINRMAGHYKTLLEAIAANPDEKIAQLEMLTAQEKQQLLVDFNTASVEYPRDKTLVELFEAQVEQTPDTLAFVYQGTTLSYRELDEQTNKIAQYLRLKGVKTGSFVAICIDDSLDIVLSIWGILKAGGTYVPLDYANPADRINFIIDHVGAQHVLTNKSCQSLVSPKADLEIVVLDEMWLDISKMPNQRPDNSLSPEHLIYVIHTSGSTGKPKGVMLTHRNVADHLYGFFSRVQFRSSKTFAIMSTMSADLANTVLFGALISGGTIHLLAKSVYTDASKTHEYFRKNSIDFMKLVPSHWRALENEEGILLPNRTIVFGGEVLSIEILEKIKAVNPKLEIINHYGPTEVTIGKVCYKVDFDALPVKTPIGKPFCNTRLYVVDKHLALCPVGVPGELLIGGDGVSKGYINRPELTAERYIKNPFSNDENDILYRSGDLIRWLPDGNLDFMDRVDDQIKVRGYRVELGEINIVLKQAPGISQSIVLAKTDANGQNRLIAYVVPEGAFNKTDVQAYLKTQLPDYMIPSLLIELDKMPLNANGKVDRKALPDPETFARETNNYVAPGNETEQQLANIWMQLLKVDRVGIHDNFFEIGGHSLLAMRVISAIRKEFALNIPLKVIFSFPTIDELQNYIHLIRESVEEVDQKEVEVIEL